jgi:hypothetical protein
VSWTPVGRLTTRVPRLEALRSPPFETKRWRGRKMHTYQRRWPEDLSNWTGPDLEGLRFRDACHVAQYVELDPVLAWRTWPEVWHLDDEGKFRCCSRGSSLDSVHRFAKRPSDMVRCRDEPVDPVQIDGLSSNLVIHGSETGTRCRRMTPEHSSDCVGASLDTASCCWT